MIKNRKFFVILMPSPISITFSVIFSIGIMAVSAISFANGRGTIYNFLFGPGSSTELISSSRTNLEVISNVVLGNAILNKILYFAFWMVVGLCVYIILYALLRGTGAASEELKEASYANVTREHILQEFAMRSVVRIAAIFAWIAFSILFVKVLLPYSSLATKNASGQLLTPIGIAYMLASLVVLVFSCHIEIVLIRFVALRVRIFGKEEIRE